MKNYETMKNARHYWWASLGKKIQLFHFLKSL